MNNIINLDVNGVRYDGFKTMSYSRSMENLSGTFRFDASTEGKRYTPFKGQEECKIIIGGQTVLTGYIENLTYSYSIDSHDIIVSGRDKSADIIDNTVIGDIEFKAPISLENIIKNTLSKSEIDLDVINNVPGLQLFEEDELTAADVGENMFGFLEKYCRKRAVLLNSDGNGNVVITRAAEDELNGIIINSIDNTDNKKNNVKNASINYDFTRRYNKYFVRSQGSLAALIRVDSSEEMGLDTIESKEGSAIDDIIRPSRSIEIQSETSATVASDIERAKWEANIRRTRSLIYNCNLNHLFVDSANKVIYEPNKLIRVKDDFCDIDATMLIQSVSYNMSVDSGTSVDLTLVPKDSYQPEPSPDGTDLKFNPVGKSAGATGIIGVGTGRLAI